MTEEAIMWLASGVGTRQHITTKASKHAV
jgi:hypothetical protein